MAEGRPATPQAEEAWARPPGSGHGESDCGEAWIGLAVPGKASVQDHDALPRPVPLPHEHGSRLEPVAAGLLPNNRTVTLASVSGSDAVQAAHGLLVEVPKAFGLEPIREHAKQQVPRQRFRRLAPEHAPPLGAQGRKIEIAQPRDLVARRLSNTSPAADARFRATLSQALRRGEETLQVGRHKRLRNFSQPPTPGEEAVNLKAPAGE